MIAAVSRADMRARDSLGSAIGRVSTKKKSRHPKATRVKTAGLTLCFGTSRAAVDGLPHWLQKGPATGAPQLAQNVILEIILHHSAPNVRIQNEPAKIRSQCLRRASSRR